LKPIINVEGRARQMSDKPLQGQVMLVTGASRGIGAATAITLAGLGAHVVLTARAAKGLEATEDAIHEAGGSATLAPLDLARGDDIDALAAAIAQRWQRLDGLILNAARLGSITPVPHMEPAEFEAVVATNLTATFRLIRATDPLLRSAPAGKVIGVTSSVARQPRAYWGAYAASKAGLEALLLTYGDEVEGISAVTVALYNPGRTRTRMRMEAFPSENPQSLPSPFLRAGEIADLLVKGFSTRSHHTGGAEG
jgi:NAD(P)-dependent dehydrogenase (short-subunit alcohol dehydrogenase family)